MENLTQENLTHATGIAISIELSVGLCGFPVFAHGGGPAYLLKPTFGFLIGFAAAAFVAGSVSSRLKKSTFRNFLLASFCGEIVYYLCGLSYYFVMFNYILAGDAETIGVVELIEGLGKYAAACAGCMQAL